SVAGVGRISAGTLSSNAPLSDVVAPTFRLLSVTRASLSGVVGPTTTPFTVAGAFPRPLESTLVLDAWSQDVVGHPEYAATGTARRYAASSVSEENCRRSGLLPTWADAAWGSNTNDNVMPTRANGRAQMFIL